MRKTTTALALVAAILAGGTSAARAESNTIFGTPGYQVLQFNGVYIGAGGQYQGLGMPTYNLGFTRATGAAFTDIGAVAEHDLRLHTAGFNALIGTLIPGMPPWLGANFRVELGGFFTTGFGATDSTLTTFNGGTQLVGGQVVAFGCDPCDWRSTLEREGNQFRLWLQAATDFPLGPDLFVSPSVGVFGTRTRVHDRLFQTFANPGATPGATDFYSADSTLRWWDIGGRGRVVLVYRVMPWAAVHVGGHVDLAVRRAEFSASDHYGDLNVRSSISGDATRFNFAAGGQVGLTLIDGNWLMVSLIGGAEFDSRVPRIQRQSTSNFVTTIGTTQQPARLAFSGAVNFSAIARVTIRIF